MIKICMAQDICEDFLSGSNKPPNHHVRATVPCTQWIGLDCEVISELLAVIRKATGEEAACDIKKIKRIKGK